MGDERIIEDFGVYELVTRVLKNVKERLERARAKLLDIKSKNDIAGLGEVIGDINKAVSDLEELL